MRPDDGRVLIRTTDASVAEARRILELERSALAEHDVPGDLSLTGGSSVAGLLTKGDIDLHLRVRPEDFTVAIERLRILYRPVHLGIWTETLAAFERQGKPPVGVAVTVIDTDHDRRFIAGWRRLGFDPVLRNQYNALKSAGGDYEAAKSNFFSRIAADPGAGAGSQK